MAGTLAIYPPLGIIPRADDIMHLESKPSLRLLIEELLAESG